MHPLTDPLGPLKTQYNPLKPLLGPPDFGPRDRWLSESYHPRYGGHALAAPLHPGRGTHDAIRDYNAPNLKLIGEIDPNDVNQGSVGDCWLLSAISSLSEFQGAVTRIFKKMQHLDTMPADGPNQYTCTCPRPPGAVKRP